MQYGSDVVQYRELRAGQYLFGVQHLNALVPADMRWRSETPIDTLWQRYPEGPESVMLRVLYHEMICGFTLGNLESSTAEHKALLDQVQFYGKLLVTFVDKIVDDLGKEYVEGILEVICMALEDYLRWCISNEAELAVRIGTI